MIFLWVITMVIYLMNNIDTGFYVYADKDILITVLRNLINNALKLLTYLQ